MWCTQTEETFIPHSIFQLIIYICTSGCVCGQVRSSMPVRLFFVLSRIFFLSPAPFQKLNNNNRAKSLPSHLVSVVWCLHRGLGFGVWALCSPVAQTPRTGPAQVWCISRLRYRMFSGQPGCGPGSGQNQKTGTRKTNVFCLFFSFLWMCLNRRETWWRIALGFRLSGTLYVVWIQGSILIQTDLFYSCIEKCPS